MIEMEDLKRGVKKYATPLYVYDLDAVEETLTAFRLKFWDTADLCFAMKANPFLTGKMEKYVDRIEVCSMGEYRICRVLGIAPEKLLISGVLKQKEDILEILEECGGTCAYTVESLNQFYCLANWCEERCEVVHVYMRLTSGNQFGMDEETLAQVIKESEKFPFLKIRGIHYFSGTQKRSTEKIKKELLYLDKICRTIGDIKELEYGPGIPVTYFQNQTDMTEMYLSELSDAITNMSWKGKVTLEMGRALTASCGYYLTSVKDIKQNNGRNYCIVDGGIHQIQYDGQIRGMYEPPMEILAEKRQGEEKNWTICGSLCTVNDIMVQKLALTEPKEGDILVFKKTGAYSSMEGMLLFLSHSLPKILLYNEEEGFRQIRKAYQTYKWNMEEN